jgi:glucose-1-phosphate cytidylyltransferase
MKAVILAGGLGTRISEETGTRPKPMVEIGGKPILWHIMKLYSARGVRDFVICLGYKGYLIKEYFANYFLHTSDVTFDMARNKMTVHRRAAEPWKVTLVDTGADTMTGGRLKRVRAHLDRGPFHMTYGDGLSDADPRAVAAVHAKSKAWATLTAVRAPMRFGALDLDGAKVRDFREKSDADGAWINGGFFVVDPKALDLIAGDETRWEAEPVVALARRGKLAAHRHSGFWHAMDTLRDKTHLESLWALGRAPWKVW